MHLGVIALALFVAVNRVTAETIVVPDDYEEIVDACGAAAAGDVILVEPGAYLGPVPIPPGVTVSSIGGPDVTIVGFSSIEGGPVTFLSGSEPAVLEGFTVEMEDYPGIAVRSFNPETIIRGNTFVGGGGGELFCRLEHGGTIEYNALGGGQFTGVHALAGSVTLSHNLMKPPCTDSVSSLFFRAEASVICVIEHNTFEPWHTVGFEAGASCTMKNNIIGGLDLRCQGTAADYDVSYNILADFSIMGVCDLGVGNLVGVWPTFCDELACDLRLTPGSPGADDGEGGVPMGAFGVGCEPIVDVPTEGDVVPVVPVVRLLTPNPTTTSTVSLAITMPSPGPIKITVFDVRGTAIRRESLERNAGPTHYDLDLGERRPSGVYFVRIAAPSWQRTMRASIIR